MMEVDVLQGTEEWRRARMAIPTASQFHRILTKKTRKLSASSDGYLHELLAEWLLDVPLNMGMDRGFIQRGSEMEQDAVRYYEFQRDVETRSVGFVLQDDRMVGCSPDRLIGTDGGLEIKCPGPAQHVANMLGMDSAYEMQAQGCMWICERQWWDVLSFHPELPPAIVRLQRDVEFIAALTWALQEFVGNILLLRERLSEHRKVNDSEAA